MCTSIAIYSAAGITTKDKKSFHCSNGKTVFAVSKLFVACWYYRSHFTTTIVIYYIYYNTGADFIENVVHSQLCDFRSAGLVAGGVGESVSPLINNQGS